MIVQDRILGIHKKKQYIAQHDMGDLVSKGCWEVNVGHAHPNHCHMLN